MKHLTLIDVMRSEKFRSRIEVNFVEIPTVEKRFCESVQGVDLSGVPYGYCLDPLVPPPSLRVMVLPC